MLNRLFQPVKDVANAVKTQISNNPVSTTVLSVMMNATLAVAQSANNGTMSPTPNSDPYHSLYPGLAIAGGLMLIAGCCFLYNGCNSKNNEDAMANGCLAGICCEAGGSAVYSAMR